MVHVRLRPRAGDRHRAGSRRRRGDLAGRGRPRARTTDREPAPTCSTRGRARSTARSRWSSKSAQRYKVKAANRRAGRGLSGDLILLDELREHQSWDAWGAITKTTMARADGARSGRCRTPATPRRWSCATCARWRTQALGDPDGHQRRRTAVAEDCLTDDDLDERRATTAEEFVEDDDSLGFFEWSAPPGCDVDDRDGWAHGQPVAGLHDHRAHDRLGSQDGPGVGLPHRGAVPVVRRRRSRGRSRRARGRRPTRSRDARVAQIVGNVKACIDVSGPDDGAHRASPGRDGRPAHVESSRSRAGQSWVSAWLTDAEAPRPVEAVDRARRRARRSRALLTELRDEAARMTGIGRGWGGSDLGRLDGRVLRPGPGRDRRGDADRLRHRTAAARWTSRPRLLSRSRWRVVGVMWDRRKSPADVAPLKAATGAVWCLTSAMPETGRIGLRDRAAWRCCEWGSSTASASTSVRRAVVQRWRTSPTRSAGSRSQYRASVELAPAEMWEHPAAPAHGRVVPGPQHRPARPALVRAGRRDRPPARPRSVARRRSLRRPNRETTTYELIFGLVGDLALYDLAYWHVAPDAEAPSGWSIVRLPPEWVAPVERRRLPPQVLRREGARAATPVTFPATEVLAFHGFNPTDPTDGLVADLERCRASLQEQLQSSMYRAAGVEERRPRLARCCPAAGRSAEWSDEARDRSARTGTAKYTGNGPRAGGTPILEDGMTLQRIDFSATEQQFVEGAKLSFATVCSGLPRQPDDGRAARQRELLQRARVPPDALRRHARPADRADRGPAEHVPAADAGHGPRAVSTSSSTSTRSCRATSRSRPPRCSRRCRARRG